MADDPKTDLINQLEASITELEGDLPQDVVVDVIRANVLALCKDALALLKA